MKEGKIKIAFEEKILISNLSKDCLQPKMYKEVNFTS